MDAGNEIAQGGEDRALPGDAVPAGEGGGNYADREMALAAAVVAGMAGMAPAVVDHLERDRSEGGAQALVDFGRDRPRESFCHSPI